MGLEVRMDMSIDRTRCIMNIKDINRTVYYNLFEQLRAEYCICAPDVTWQSKSNCYVQYEYEPFDCSGFSINIACTVRTMQEAEFIKYLLQKATKEHLEKEITVDYFNRCLEAELEDEHELMYS